MDKPCPRCLTDELTNGEYFKSMYDYIDTLDPEIKTASEEYSRRLALCNDCPKLINGMCALCGCFVEVRAAKKTARCPNIARVW